jgi:hypothetical protein
VAAIPAEAQRIIDSLSAIDLERPRIDHTAVEAAFADHFRRRGTRPRPVRWMKDIEEGAAAARAAAASGALSAGWSGAESVGLWAPPPAVRSDVLSVARSAARSRTAREAASAAAWAAWPARGPEAWSDEVSAARSAAWSAVELAEWSAAWSVARNLSSSIRQWLDCWRPFVDASEAGLWLFWVLEKSVLAVPRAVLRIQNDDQLHCEDGPAVFWPEGARYYFLRGVQVPEWLVLRPELLRPHLIVGERNAEVRRIMLDRLGAERFVRRHGEAEVHADEYGTLYRIRFPNDEDLVMVKVVNATPEPNGSFKDYFLRVPPDVRTARGAVAWTFGMAPEDYEPAMQT